MVMQYGGGGPMAPAAPAAAPSGPATNISGESPTSPVETNLFKLKAYEEDGDSVLGALLPNVYIKKIKLEEAPFNDDMPFVPQYTSGKLVNRDPHITTSAPNTNELIAENILAKDEVKDLRLSINLMIKEKIENDDVSLFSIEDITRSLRLRVMIGLNNSFITMVKTAGLTTNYENPQEIGKLISGDLFPGSKENSPFYPHTYNSDGTFLGEDKQRYQYVDIPLADLPQFKAIINGGDHILKEWYKFKHYSKF